MDTPAPGRADARAHLYRRLPPFADLPSVEAIERRIAAHRDAGDDDALEETLCRLTLTAQRYALPEAAALAGFPNSSGEPHALAPFHLPDVWAIIRRERADLDARAVDPDRSRLRLALHLLDLPGVTGKATFREAAQRAMPEAGADPGGALWKAVQRLAKERLGPHLPERYTRHAGFRALVVDLLSDRLDGRRDITGHDPGETGHDPA